MGARERFLAEWKARPWTAGGRTFEEKMERLTGVGLAALAEHLEEYRATEGADNSLVAPSEAEVEAVGREFYGREWEVAALRQGFRSHVERMIGVIDRVRKRDG